VAIVIAPALSAARLKVVVLLEVKARPVVPLEVKARPEALVAPPKKAVNAQVIA